MEITISGVIGYDFTSSMLSEKLKKADGDDVTILISSEGGYVFDAIDMYNQIRRYPGNISAEIIGLAASAASYIPLAADSIAIYDNSVMMIHNAMLLAYGDYNEFRKQADSLEALSKHMAKAYINKTGKDPQSIYDMMDAETWLYGSEILDHGFADTLVESENETDQTEAVAEAKTKFLMMKKSLDQDKYNNSVEKAAALYKEQPKNIAKVETMNKEELFKSLMALKDKGELSTDEIAQAFTMSLVTDEHRKAIEQKNAVAEMIGDTDPVEFIKEAQANAKAVRESKMQNLFGTTKDDDPKKDARMFADSVLDGKELNDQNIKMVQEHPVYMKLLGEIADVNSPVNQIGVVESRDESVASTKQKTVKLG